MFYYWKSLTKFHVIFHPKICISFNININSYCLWSIQRWYSFNFLLKFSLHLPLMSKFVFSAIVRPFSTLNEKKTMILSELLLIWTLSILISLPESLTLSAISFLNQRHIFPCVDQVSLFLTPKTNFFLTVFSCNSFKYLKVLKKFKVIL